MWVNQSENKSCNFVAPAGLTADKEVLFPVSDVQAPAAAATLAVNIKQMQTFLQPGTMGAAMTINLTIDAQVSVGAKIHLKATSDGTARAITFGTGFSAPALAGFASKTWVQTFIYDGTAYLPCGAAVQIN